MYIDHSISARITYDGGHFSNTPSRYFLDKVVDHLWALGGEGGEGRVVNWQGTFTEYLQYTAAMQERRRQEAAAARPRPSGPSPPPSAVDPKEGKPLSRYELQRMGQLEAQLEALGARRAEMQSRVDELSRSSDGYTELAELCEQLEQLGVQVGVVEDMYLELAIRE